MNEEFYDGLVETQGKIDNGWYMVINAVGAALVVALFM
jgi:hypothetical protein